MLYEYAPLPPQGVPGQIVIQGHDSEGHLEASYRKLVFAVELRSTYRLRPRRYAYSLTRLSKLEDS